VHFVADLEHDLMSYCLKYHGKWWANHFFYNNEVRTLYSKLRGLDVGTVIAIVGSGDADYEKQIRIYEKIVMPVLQAQKSKETANAA
jgi:hypothetical protein